MKTLHLFCFIDALGWSLPGSRTFLSGMLSYRQPLDTIFGYSSTCDPTILTGLMPRDHGHFSFYRFSPSTSPFRPFRFLSALPRSVTDRGRVRHHISRMVGRMLGYTGYFQLYAMPFSLLPYFDYTEKRDLYQPNGILSGARTIFDDLRDRKIPFSLSDWRASEETNLAALEADLKTGVPRFAYLYLAAMDAVLHQYGTAHPRVAEKLAWYERRLEHLMATARGSYDEVRLHVFSDHGMTDVTALSGLMADIDSLGLKFGQQYAVVYDSTMARFWFPDPQCRPAIVDLLKLRSDGRILTDEELRRWGADFSGQKYGELFFLLNPGVLLCPGHLGTKPLAGMHGYEPEHPDSTAFYGSNTVPGRPPARLDDLYGLMREAVAALDEERR